MKTHVGPYRVEEELGHGGMGVVYRGMHEQLGRQVAIKALLLEFTQQPEFKERFFSEARAQARLQHPNIVTVFDLVEEDGEFFIIMELVAGKSCDELLREHAGQGLPFAQALAIFSQVLIALDYAHSEGVIHRDVKPSNILISSDQRVRLMDFGVALLVGDKRLTSSRALVGTPIYMSPEQILRPRQMDHRTDIYSAAIVFHEMLAGAPPFDAESIYEINKLQIEMPPPDLAMLNSAVPAPVAAVVAQALAKSPDDRFTSAGEMLRALYDAAAVTTAPPVPGTAAVWPRGAQAGTSSRATGDRASRPAGIPPTELMQPARMPQAVATPVPSSGAAHQPDERARPLPKLLAIVGAVAVILVAVAFGMSRLGTERPPASVPAAGSAPTAAQPAPQAPLALPAIATATAGAVPAEGQAVRRLPETAETAAPAVGTLPAADDSGRRHGRGTNQQESPRAAAPRPQPAANRDAERETRRREVARVRDMLRHGIDGVKTDLEAQQFTAAREKLGQLQELAVPYRADLIDEAADLRALDQEITSRQISVKTKDLTREHEEASWRQRLQQIRGLIQEKSYPEAKNLANQLANEPGAPDDVVAEARDLGVQADRELRSIFLKTKVKSNDAVVKKPPGFSERRRQ